MEYGEFADVNRWTFSQIEPLRAGTVFDWGVDEQAGLWAAYKAPNGWIAKVSIDDGRKWHVKKVAVNGQPIDALTAQRLTRCDDDMRDQYGEY